MEEDEEVSLLGNEEEVIVIDPCRLLHCGNSPN
jgi:hypothetical protein